MIATVFKNTSCQIKDLDEKKGVVQIYINAFNNEDSDGDISIKGSFQKTIKENFDRFRHLFNHDTAILLGLPLEMIEDDYGVLTTSKMNIKKQIVRDVYEDYILFKENNRSLEHSVRVNPIKRDKQDPRLVTEWRLWEYSTLAAWGANSQTPLLGIKNLSDLEIMMSKGNYSEEKHKTIQALYGKLKTLMEQPEALDDEPQPLDQEQKIRDFYLSIKI
ncbi:MAG: HK97 family phage prohead protease [Synergistaceae bacterium]|jgi:HK97 family phage prohead protease